MSEIKLIHGDCLEKMNEIANGSIDLVLTDPPYNISSNNNFSSLKARDGKAKYSSIDFGEWDKGFNENDWVNCVCKKLRKGGSIVCFCSWKQLGKYIALFEENGLLVKNMMQWVKPNSAPKNRDRLYIVNYEVMIWAAKGTGWTFNRLDSKRQLSQFVYPFVSGKEKTIHPTQKPIKLMTDLIKIHSNENDIVLDCFMGSGTTGVACANTNRSFIGIELDENYFKIARERVDKCKPM